MKDSLEWSNICWYLLLGNLSLPQEWLLPGKNQAQPAAAPRKLFIFLKPKSNHLGFLATSLLNKIICFPACIPS